MLTWGIPPVYEWAFALVLVIVLAMVLASKLSVAAQARILTVIVKPIR